MHEIDIVYKGVHLTFRLSFWCLHFILVFISHFGVKSHFGVYISFWCLHAFRPRHILQLQVNTIMTFQNAKL